MRRGRLLTEPPDLEEGAERSVGLTVRVRVELAEWLRQEALREHRSISGQVARLVDDAYRVRTQGAQR